MMSRAPVPEPRPEDATAIAAAIRAQKAMEAFSWPTDALDQETHGIVFGSQVLFQAGLNPFEIGRLILWARGRSLDP
jgi:hypothetical protein